MSFFNPSYAVLTIAYLNQEPKCHVPARTLLVGAGLFTVQQRYGDWQLHVGVHASLSGDNPAAIMEWLDDRLWRADTLLFWNPETVVVPALAAAAQSSPDLQVAVQILRQLHRVLDGRVVDVAALIEGEPLGAVTAWLSIPLMPMTNEELAAAYTSNDQLAMREHLASKVIAIWRVWLARQDGQEDLVTATAAWLAQREGAREMLP